MGGSEFLFIPNLHRANLRFDEGDLALCESVFLVEIFVSPLSVHAQDGHKRVSILRDMVRIHELGHKKAEQSCFHVDNKIPGLCFFLVISDNKVCFRADCHGR